ncbi:hypothetical protein BVH03_22190 [Pseudomonas sp. PA15(2017)]|uniref:hypothetical protein n=1 Tax=Pseudomonas sp. PA15(2017) TaxID=1932111 RepID=UPI0009614AF7|nr:hypothetical protein [Pseudomonas sp. PA15(2017)]OLU22962.1 hypothetical protein BVH03_22190 [Pseudomonas sp. PA15(2017)]
MSYGVTLYNLFIASPGDVGWARTQIRQSAYLWNEVNTKHRKAVLFPLGWETNSAPNMGAPAQQIINETLLSEADILVGVFWTRLGTPTAEFESGTVEEIERHIKAGKPTLLYFSEQPVALGSVDMEEYERLQTFKKSCQSRGLYHQFEDQPKFVEDFNRHLGMHVNELLGAQPVSTAATADVGIPSVARGLSEAAKILIKQASKDAYGKVMTMEAIGSSLVQTNGKQFVHGDDPRETAKWFGAVRELVKAGYLLPKGAKGQVFDVTALGYEYADTLPD